MDTTAARGRKPSRQDRQVETPMAVQMATAEREARALDRAGEVTAAMVKGPAVADVVVMVALLGMVEQEEQEERSVVPAGREVMVARVEEVAVTAVLEARVVAPEAKAETATATLDSGGKEEPEGRVMSEALVAEAEMGAMAQPEVLEVREVSPQD